MQKRKKKKETEEEAEKELEEALSKELLGEEVETETKDIEAIQTYIG